MNDFFILNQKGDITIKPEALLIPSFKSLKDKYKKNDEYIKYFSYIYHVCDYSSPYRNYPQRTREEKVAEVFRIDTKCKTLQEAINQYNEFNFSPTLSLWEAVKSKVFEMERYMKNTAITEDNFKDFFGSFKDLGKVVESLNKLEEQVKTEKAKEGSARGGATINPREIPR